MSQREKPPLVIKVKFHCSWYQKKEVETIISNFNFDERVVLGDLYKSIPRIGGLTI